MNATHISWNDRYNKDITWDQCVCYMSSGIQSFNDKDLCQWIQADELLNNAHETINSDKQTININLYVFCRID